MTSATPAFVFIDDRPDEDGFAAELAAALGQDQVGVVTYPTEFEREELRRTKELLQNCRVVLMDLDLGYSDDPRWGLDPSSGLALEESLRGWLARDSADVDLQPIAFVLTSSKLDSLPPSVTGSLPVAGREHVVARNTDNEWVLEKLPQNRLDTQRNLSVLAQLSDAVDQLRNLSPVEEDAEKKKSAFRLLGIADIDSEDWTGIAVDEAEKTGFPTQSIFSGSDTSLIKWLLHIALPFPGVFCEIRDVALALRLDPADVRKDGGVTAALHHRMTEFEYSGILSGFLGKHWWRAGIHEFKSEIWDRCGRNQNKIWAALEMELDVSLSDIRRIKHPDPVLLVDASYRRTDRVCDASDGVRILSDDWPDEIFPPWIARDQAYKNKRLRELVRPEDEYRLDD
jgi:hypothetical protein